MCFDAGAIKKEKNLMKYAFIMNSAGLDPESYSTTCENGSSQYLFTAVHGMKMARELAAKLAEDGYGLIDLCGDFDGQKAVEVEKAAAGKIQVNYAKYSEADLAKFDALPATDKYGIIVMGFDLTENLVKLEMNSDEFNTYISIVAKEDDAAVEAAKMVAEGIHFIELCGFFDADKAEKIAAAIGHKVPMGYCG